MLIKTCLGRKSLAFQNLKSAHLNLPTVTSPLQKWCNKTAPKDIEIPADFRARESNNCLNSTAWSKSWKPNCPDGERSHCIGSLDDQSPILVFVQIPSPVWRYWKYGGESDIQVAKWLFKRWLLDLQWLIWNSLVKRSVRYICALGQAQGGRDETRP